MAAYVIFFTPKGIGPTVHAPGVGLARVREAVTVPGTTEAKALEGEVVMVFNGDDAVALVALGSTPDASATSATTATTAGLPIPAGQMSEVLIPNEGDAVNVKALA
jgi:hypothetical protein